MTTDIENSAGQSFDLAIPMHCFEKADANPGEEWRIAGVASTDDDDLQGQRILQEGLDYSYFLQRGWFNDDHQKGPGAVVGYPIGSVLFFKPGEQLPDGEIAKSSCSWVEGYLLKTKKGQEIWDVAKSLDGNPDRKLSFSIEGGIIRVDPKDKANVTRAVVQQIAITHKPVNVASRLVTLAKSLGMGDGITPMRCQITGAAGSILAVESLEKDRRYKKLRQPMSLSESFTYVKSLRPDISDEMAWSVVEHTEKQKARGRK